MSPAYIKPKPAHVVAILARLRDTDGQGPLVTISQIMQIFQTIDQSVNSHFVILIEANNPDSDIHVGLAPSSGIRNLRNHFDEFPGFYRWLNRKPYIPDVYKPSRVSKKTSPASTAVDHLTNEAEKTLMKP